jgi:hypothetical protein
LLKVVLYQLRCLFRCETFGDVANDQVRRGAPLIQERHRAHLDLDLGPVDPAKGVSHWQRRLGRNCGIHELELGRLEVGRIEERFDRVTDELAASGRAREPNGRRVGQSDLPAIVSHDAVGRELDQPLIALVDPLLHIR